MGGRAGVFELPTARSSRVDEAAAVLLEAQDERFESVIVMGFRGGQLFIQSSSCKSTLELIGALEAAKMQLWGAKA